MIDILLAGVGGQGTVLAAKLLASAAASKGWKVRTAETIGMAQRGGSVTSHVRMGCQGEAVFAPLLTPGTADLIVAFEPAEAARALPYLAPDGLLVTASSALQPVTAALSAQPYTAIAVLDDVRAALASQAPEAAFLVVEEAPILEKVGASRALNVVLLASALAQGRVPISIEELKEAVSACVKPRFVAMNLEAIDLACVSE